MPHRRPKKRVKQPQQLSTVGTRADAVRSGYADDASEDSFFERPARGPFGRALAFTRNWPRLFLLAAVLTFVGVTYFIRSNAAAIVTIDLDMVVSAGNVVELYVDENWARPH